MNKFEAWGRYPKINSCVFDFLDIESLSKHLETTKELIAYGNGKSYGDSCLNTNIVHTKPYKCFLDFDDVNGILECQSGVLLSEILSLIIRKGWFLKVVPGTKSITLGGAIASDIHGKNHHKQGCFSNSLIEFNILLANGEIKKCSRNNNQELFQATCGGMGLTGIIIDAKIQLQKINSTNIKQTTIKTSNLQETFQAFEEAAHYPYSVAWIDCFAPKHEIGKSILMLGEFAQDNHLNYKEKSKINIPFDFPSFTLNPLSIKTFNWLYYNKNLQQESQQLVDLETFFFPLDSIKNWNRIYGKNGFTQYQFILPKIHSYNGLQEILSLIAENQKGSFLAVLKLFGPENENYLSFPIEGYSLALDFKIEPGLFEFLNKLDEVVLKYGGRIYLAKDSRILKENFEKGYGQIEKFRKLRKKYQLDKIFHSLQSKRLGL
jgi:decaprenylphospho-beta-D-ribofuranose 2-oxidase